MLTKSKHFLKNDRKTRSMVNTASNLNSKEVKNPIVKQEFDTFENELVKFEKSNESLTNKPASRKRKRKYIKVEVESESELKSKNSIPKDKKVTKRVPISYPSKPPPNFWPMYNTIKKMRAKIVTPVDTMGCSKIPTRITGFTSGKIFRFQTLIALMLSSQTKDEANFEVMKNLHNYFLNNGFKDGLCVEAINQVDENVLDKLIFKIGFHNRKTVFLKKATKILIEKFNGDIPDNLDDLISLPGVGFKMSHLVLQIAWNKVEGISVDTHVARLAGWYNWVPKIGKPGSKTDPDYVRKCLESMLSDHKEIWREINPVLVGFGQVICTPVAPRCDICQLANEGCPALDKRLLTRVKRGVEDNRKKKSRGDLSELMKELE